MNEVILPPWIQPEQENHEWLDEGSSPFRAQFAPGLTQRQSYGGLRLKLSRRHTVRGEEKAQLLAALNSTRGRYNTLRTKVHFVLRGSFAAPELVTNGMFDNGTTGWTVGTDYALSVSDRIMVCRRAQVTTTAGSVARTTVPVTQYSPHVLRAFMVAGRGALDKLAVANVGTEAISSEGVPRYVVQSYTPRSSSILMGLTDGSTGANPDDYFLLPWVSVAPGPLIDTGTNLLLQSDELDTSWTATRASVDDQATAAPDGTATADSIIEDSSPGNTHNVQQVVTVPAAVGDYCFCVALKAGARTWAQLQLIEGTGSATLGRYFDLSGGGATGIASTGVNWADNRAFVSSLGNGWVLCCLVGRKTNAATSMTARILIAQADGAVAYSGDGTSNIYAWRATLARSSVPTRLVQTTTTASTGTAPTGNAVHVKGLRASTSGLLLPDDWFEINGELKQCIAPLSSDAAGRGYLQFEPALFRSPSNDDPVVIADPMGKFLVSNIKIDNEFGVQARVSYDLEHIYE